MKRVFEGIVFERRRIGDNAIGACTTEAFEEFYQSLPIGKATRITAEDLPESKPEKNCGNCGAPDAFCHTEADEKFCKSWQPKPAEPQGWEQRFDKEFPHCGGAFKTSVIAFIRAEIERVREKSEHEVCIARQEGYVRGLKEAREQNKHREAGE